MNAVAQFKRPLHAVPAPFPIGTSVIINKQGHEYDTRRVRIENIFSERQKVLVHVEGHIYITLRYADVIIAPGGAA